MTVKNEKELGEALKQNQNYIEVEGDLCKKVIKIKATGPVAWAVCIAGLSIAVVAVIATIGSGGGGAPVTVPASTAGLLPAVAVFGGGSAGLSVASSSVLIAVAGGGVGALNKLRKYKIEKKDKKVILRRK